VSLKAMEKGKVEEASKGTVRQTITLNAGIDADKARSINKEDQGDEPQGVSSQTQGDQVPRLRQEARRPPDRHRRPQRATTFGIPLQFQNFRD